MPNNDATSYSDKRMSVRPREILKSLFRSCLSKNECPNIRELIRQEPATQIIATNAKSYDEVNSNIITIEAIGAPITDADKAAIAARIKVSPKSTTPKEFPKYVKAPPIAAPKQELENKPHQKSHS